MPNYHVEILGVRFPLKTYYESLIRNGIKPSKELEEKYNQIYSPKQ